MSFVVNNSYVAYFGNREDNLKSNQDYSTDPFNTLFQKLSKHAKHSSLVFLKQIHSDAIISITNKQKPGLSLFETTGDAIITNQNNIAIGVMTADCLPICLYDPTTHTAAVIHAGWKGLSKNIISKTILAMKTQWGVKTNTLKVYLGPCAKNCCYEVTTEFSNYFSSKTLEERNNQLFFNMILAAKNELLDNHISENFINLDNILCTICNPEFCSYRREKENAGRQATVIVMKN